MLEKPDLADETIITCLQENFDLQDIQIKFLPIGADINSAVYCVELLTGQKYFLKLRRGKFAEISAILPGLIHDQGVEQVIRPFSTLSGNYYACLDQYCVILYPYIDGKDGYNIDLSDSHLVELGKVINQIHFARIPQKILMKVPSETFSDQFIVQMQSFLQQFRTKNFSDPVSAKMAKFLFSRQETVKALLARTIELSRIVVDRSQPFVLCHSDLHAGNILIDTHGRLYIVDWDTLLRAPKERDLMFIGGGQGFRGHSDQEEIELFYRGYSKTLIDQEVQAYYRYARIIEDITVDCKIILSPDQKSKDRKRSFEFLKSNFRTNGVIEIAIREDKFRFK